MQLSPEERHKIYEEEKARIEAQQKQRMTTGGSTTGLEPNIAGLLCYLGGWITLLPRWLDYWHCLSCN